MKSRNSIFFTKNLVLCFKILTIAISIIVFIVFNKMIGAAAAATVSSSCVPPPPSMVAWFPGDGNANDIQGSNNGTVSNSGVTFTAGKVTQAFTEMVKLNKRQNSLCFLFV